MNLSQPDEVLLFVISRVAEANWQADSSRLRDELAGYLTQDLIDGPYELVGVSPAAKLSVLNQSDDMREFIVSWGGLPDKAALKLGCDGRWRLESFLGQCTGCLGSGDILGKSCTSCSGTGWGLRPS